MFHDDMDDGFWAEGPGAMSWKERTQKDGSVHLALAVILPGDRTASLIYPRHEPGNWSQPGPRQGWNGDRERPTFKPSIQAPNWHGYIIHGELTTAPCPDSCCKVQE